MHMRIQVSLRLLLAIVFFFAVSLQLMLSTFTVWRLQTENAILKSRISELVPLSYDQVSSQFVDQLEKQIESNVEVLVLRYEPRVDEYYIRFACFATNKQRWETAISMTRVSPTEYYAVIRKLPVAPNKEIPITIHFIDDLTLRKSAFATCQ